MHVIPHCALNDLNELLMTTKNKNINQRIEAVSLFAQGLSMKYISETFGKCISWVSKWVKRFISEGIECFTRRLKPGPKPKISKESLEELKQRILAGPTEEDEQQVFRGKDVVEILKSEFNVTYSLSGVYNLLHKARLSSIKPRPVHEKNDPAKMDAFKNKVYPEYIKKVKAENPDKKIDVWFQDETRFGEQGRLVKVWANTNTRPKQVKQLGYQSAYIIGSVNPLTGEHIGHIFNDCDSEIMSIHLKDLSTLIAKDTIGILITDNASWHKSNSLKVPENLKLLYLPAYSPELNPIERLWLELKDKSLSNRVFNGIDDIISAGCSAWNKLTKNIVKSVCKVSWIDR